MPSQSIREAANSCLHSCLPKPSPSQQETEIPTAGVTSSVADSRRFFVTTTATSFFPSIKFTNHESLSSLEDAFAQFIESYPRYIETDRIDEIRAQEFYHLSLADHVCLDYIGIGLFSFSQFHNQLSLAYPTASTSSEPVQSNSQVSEFPLFGLSFRSVNLKTELITSTKDSRLEVAIKKRIMDFLNISSEDYSVVLTSNRTAAFRLLAESYPFQSHRKLLTVYDHQSESVEAMISSSAKRGSQAMAAEFTWTRLRIQSTKLKSMLVGKGKRKKRGLFVFQLQSRMSGARYSYQWMKIAQENGWHVLLDSCALRPKDMDSLGLSLLQPDFLICSFYKVFGEMPSGFGCLFVKKSAISILEDSTIVGIATIIPANRFLHPVDQPSDTDTEDDQSTNCDPLEVHWEASANFSGPISRPIPQSRQLELEEQQIQDISSSSWSADQSTPRELEIEEIKSASVPSHHQNPTKLSRKKAAQIEFRCLDHVDSLGLTLINNRGRYLTNWLINALTKLHHPNSEKRNPLVKIYGPKIKFDRGPALAFNVFDWKGEKVEPLLIQKLADRKSISLSHGFLQNIWFPEKYEGDKGKVLEKRRLDSPEMGVKVVTAALGYLADFEDVYRVWVFIAHFLDADFVEKERWRFTALNQKTIEI
ncbi:hypothetical protein V2J09_014541 [Rumex salicifolius]